VIPSIKSQISQPEYTGEINPIFKAAGDYEVIPMDRVRQLIA
jgi:hypothetical protein